MTKELREPPLLSDEEIRVAMFQAMADFPNDSKAVLDEEYKGAITVYDRQIAQREADIKWMKEHCYLIAKRKLSHLGWRDDQFTGTKEYGQGYKQAQQDMLKEVNGVSFKAVKEFGDEAD